MTPTKKTVTKDVATHIFEEFLQALENAGMPQDLLQRLGKTLLDDKKYSESALKSALHFDEGSE